MSYNHYVFAKWTKGESVERSMKKPTSGNNSQTYGHGHGNLEHIVTTQMFDNINDTEYGYSSENSNGNINSYSNGGLDDLGNGFTRQTTKRDSFNEMLSHRDLHTQVGQNPFLAGESYIQHLKVQEDYLRPQNTNDISPNTNS